MYKWLIGIIALIALAIPFAQRGTEHAIAQGQVFCQTRPPGTSDNSCASTAFVQTAVGGGGSTTITNGSTNTSGFTNTYVLISTASKVGQVIGSTIVNGVTCALGGSCTIPSVGITNASGSAQSTTCTMSAASHTATLGLAKDFVNGQGFRCNHAGAAFTLNQPTGITVTPQGTPGVTTCQYKIASIDAHGGVGIATSLAQTTTCSATLSTANWNLIQWTPASGTAPTGYAIYKNISGTFTLIGIGSSSGAFGDYGYTAWPYADWLPTTAPASALADALVTTISAGGGTTTLTLVGASTTAATATGAFHDDTAAVQAALSASLSVQFPAGTFYISGPLTMQDGQLVTGQYIATTIISAYIGEKIFNPDIYDRVSNLAFELLPLSSAVYSNNNFVIQIDDLICQGSSVGGVANSNCINIFGGYSYTIRDIYSNYWGATLGVGNGGMPPTILVDYNPAHNNTSVFMTNITVSNDGNQPMEDGGVNMFTFDNCYNCSLSHSYMNGQNPTPTKSLGGVGVEMKGGSQALYMVDDQLLNFETNIRMDADASGSPLNLDVVDSHFDFCQQYCILGQDGLQINVTGSSFVGEGNSPWNFTNNVGIHTASGFTQGPNLIFGNGFNNFSGAGAAGVTFAGTMSNTSMYGNQFVSNTTNFSGVGDATSAIAPSCAAGVPTAAFYTINGIPGAC